MPRPTRQEDIARVPTQPTAGRTLVTRRAVFDIVRTATLGSYGVTGFASGPLDRLLGWLGFGHPGIAVHLGETLDIELDLTVPTESRSRRSRARSIRRSATRSVKPSIGKCVA